MTDPTNVTPQITKCPSCGSKRIKTYMGNNARKSFLCKRCMRVYFIDVAPPHTCCKCGRTIKDTSKTLPFNDSGKWIHIRCRRPVDKNLSLREVQK